MARDPRNGAARAEMAYICARLGDSRRAESEAAQALRFSPNDKDTRWMGAVTYEALGLRESSLAVLGSSPGAMLPGLLAELSRYPEVADLSKDSRFLQLRAAYQVH